MAENVSEQAILNVFCSSQAQIRKVNNNRNFLKLFGRINKCNESTKIYENFKRRGKSFS
jgi:hypothetical protein